MDRSITIIVFSKYSSRSDDFLKECDDYFLDENRKMLCVDNEEVRQLLEQDDCGYQIKFVPCVLVFHESGKVEKHEAIEAFSWLRCQSSRKRQQEEQVGASSSYLSPKAPLFLKGAAVVPQASSLFTFHPTPFLQMEKMAALPPRAVLQCRWGQ